MACSFSFSFSLSRSGVQPARLAVSLACLLLTAGAGLAATLSGSLTPQPAGTTSDLSAEGNVDWAHWGLTTAGDVNRRLDGGATLGHLTALGTQPPELWPETLHGCAWTNGTPVLAVSNTTSALFARGLSNGFELTVPVAAHRQRLKLFIGVQAAAGGLEAVLSDPDAPEYLDAALLNPDGPTNGVYSLDFSSPLAGQTLRVRFTSARVFDPEGGGVTWQAATLATNFPPAVSLLSPTNGAVFYYTASIPFEAEAGDRDGEIAKVEFYAGALKLDEAYAPPFALTWDFVAPGNYILTARAMDNEGAVSVSAPVAVRVSPNLAPTATVLDPVNGQNFTLGQDISLAATATDLDGSVTQVVFFANGNPLGAVAAHPYTFTWTNPPLGNHLLSVQAMDNEGAAGTSPSVEVFVTTHGGFLSGHLTPPPGTVDLTAEGRADWVHWGLLSESSVNRKAGVARQISDRALLGSEPAYRFEDNANGYTWSDGTPTATANDTYTGLYVVGLNNGFLLSAPAGPATNTLRLHVGAFGARGRLVAFLGDFTAPVYVNTAIDNFATGPGGIYTLRYAAASTGQTLTVRFTVDAMRDVRYGNVTLQAATLVTDNDPPAVALTSPTHPSAFLAPATILLAADASDGDGVVREVEFFQGETSLGAVTPPPYALSWSNVPPGNYALTARATDDRGATFTTPPARVFVGLPGGSLSARAGAPPFQLDLTAAGALDWAHWGYTTAASFNHKRAASVRISSLARVGEGPLRRYTDNRTAFTWSDGTPAGAATGTRSGVFIVGLSNGFQITAPADPTPRRLKVYAGLYGARARSEVSLNDFSAPPYLDATLQSAYGNAYRVYTIEYAAASPGRALVFRHTVDTLFDAQFGNVTLAAATLEEVPLPRLVNPQWTTEGFRFAFGTESNRLYRVEYRDSLAPLNWNLLGTLPGTGVEVPVLDAGPAPFQRFYRVLGE